jgi:hypothetical protein
MNQVLAYVDYVNSLGRNINMKQTHFFTGNFRNQSGGCETKISNELLKNPAQRRLTVFGVA